MHHDASICIKRYQRVSICIKKYQHVSMIKKYQGLSRVYRYLFWRLFLLSNISLLVMGEGGRQVGQQQANLGARSRLGGGGTPPADFRS